MDDPKAVAPANKQLIREAIAGYAVAAEYIEQEQIERLRQMTPEQSRADYAALVRFYELLKNRNDEDGLKRLEEWLLQEKIAMRRLFESAARDVEGAIVRQSDSLDLHYIHSWLTVFANWLETDDIIDRFDQAWRKYGPEV